MQEMRPDCNNETIKDSPTQNSKNKVENEERANHDKRHVVAGIEVSVFVHGIKCLNKHGI